MAILIGVFVLIVICGAVYGYFRMRSSKYRLAREVRDRTRREVDLGHMDSTSWGGWGGF